MRADLDPSKQKDEDNPDRDTDFKELMTKLKIDNEDYELISKGSVVSVIYRLNGVKVSGKDLEVKVCDFIEAKKEERRQHERDVARAKNNSAPPKPKEKEEEPNLLGSGYLKVGGHK